MDDQDYQSKGKRVHFPDHLGPCPLEECSEFKPIKPYEDGLINANFRIYNRSEKKTEINEKVLDSFIDRVLLSASMNLDQEQQNYGIMDAEDGLLTHPENLVGPRDDNPMPHKEQNKKGRKSDRKGRKGRKNETKVVEKTLSHYLVSSYPYVPKTLIIPLSEFQRLMISEVNSKARNIHEYYEYHFNNLQGDRVIAYRNLVVWKEHASRIQKELQDAIYEIRRLDAENQIISAELLKIKTAKKQKRNAAKQRRMNNSEAALSVSHT